MMWWLMDKTMEEHYQNLMKNARCEDLCFYSAKCVMNQKEIQFGAVFSENGLHSDTRKVDEIKLLQSLNNVVEIQKMLGIITYMVLFIPYSFENC